MVCERVREGGRETEGLVCWVRLIESCLRLCVRESMHVCAMRVKHVFVCTVYQQC